MQKDCHRCGALLGLPETFCPNCGAPQLLYDPGADGAAVAAEAGNPGPREIQWKSAVGAAVTFAVPVGLLCSQVVPVLSGFCCLWVVGGSMAAVWLYQRRSASRVLPRPIGTRIGTIIGILAAAVAAASNAGATVYERYVLHSGEAMDKAFQSLIEQWTLASTQLTAAYPAEAAAMTRFWLSPDGRATLTLSNTVSWSIGITVFSMIGGALGTRLFSGRNPAPRNT